MNAQRTVLKAQVVVIGSGGGGMTAAVAAAEKGASVIVLEKRHGLGGNTALAWSIFGAESKLQQQMNIKTSRDDFFKIHMEYAHWTVNPRIVRAFIDKSGDTIGWLQEKGVEFHLPVELGAGTSRTYFQQEIPSAAHYIKESRGIKLINLLAQRLEELGGSIYTDTPAGEIILNDNNEVTGVVATSAKKGEIKIETGCVVIATGGYAGNKELLRKYCSYYHENIRLMGVPNMGDGLMMAMKAGAATEGLGMLHTEAKTTPGNVRQMLVLGMQPDTLWVNKRGERFVEESAGVTCLTTAPATIRQPETITYTIIDDSIRESMDKVLTETGSYAGWKKAWPMRPGEKIVDLRTLLKAESKKGYVKISDSWDEIAAWIGAKPETLKATVNEYNAFCDNKHDAMFVKDPEYLLPLRTPPYYAIETASRSLSTIGGIKINEKMEVLNPEDNPIPGLYAAGIDTGGWESEPYNAYLYAHAFGFAVNSGRIAGESASGYTLSK